MTIDATDGAVLECECRHLSRRLSGEQPDVVQHRFDISRAHRLVLGRERIDRRRDHKGAARIGPVRRVRRPAEHIRVDIVEVRAQELPRSFRLRVHGVGAHMAAPHHDHPRSRERLREPCGLGIVQQDDVARSDQRQQLVGVGAQDLLVVTPFVASERAAVAGRAMEVVVDALRDLEEVRIALDDDPLGVDARTAGVRQERAEHLGDPATGRGRVDVQHDASGQLLASSLCCRLESFGAVRSDQREQPVGGERRDLDLFELHRTPLTR